MKKSINQWSFPDPDNQLDAGLRLARDAGFEAVELCMETSGPVSLESSDAGLNAIKKTLGELELDVASICTKVFWETSLTAGDPAVRTEAVRRLRRMIEIAAIMETDAILVVPGAVDVFFMPEAEVVSYDDVDHRSREALTSVLPDAERDGVCLCVENVWNRFILSPLEMQQYVNSFNSPYVGVYFDVGNVLPFGYPEQWLRILGEQIKRIHLKDFRRNVGTVEGFVDLLGGDVNWPEVMQALQDIGYDGYLTAETASYVHHAAATCYTTSIAMDFIMGRR